MSAFTEGPHPGAGAESHHEHELDEPAGQDPGHSPVPAQPVLWPAGPLDAAQRAFELLTRPPAPLAFDCRGIRHLPQRLVALDELRRLLIHDGTPRATRDAVWAELVTRARRDGQAWVVAVIGLALPGLRRRAARLAPGWHGDRADLDGELLLGFLERLRTIDVRVANIFQRLIEAGARQVKRSRRQAEQDIDAIRRAGTARSLPPARPWDHPDLVLTRAVALAVIGVEECVLIAETRLEDVPLGVVAERLGISDDIAAAWRRSGERALAEAILSGELRWAYLSEHA
jgi:hypothetical protein